MHLPEKLPVSSFRIGRPPSATFRVSSSRKVLMLRKHRSAAGTKPETLTFPSFCTFQFSSDSLNARRTQHSGYSRHAGSVQSKHAFAGKHNLVRFPIKTNKTRSCIQLDQRHRVR